MPTQGFFKREQLAARGFTSLYFIVLLVPQSSLMTSGYFQYC